MSSLDQALGRIGDELERYSGILGAAEHGQAGLLGHDARGDEDRADSDPPMGRLAMIPPYSSRHEGLTRRFDLGQMG